MVSLSEQRNLGRNLGRKIRTAHSSDPSPPALDKDYIPIPQIPNLTYAGSMRFRIPPPRLH